MSRLVCKGQDPNWILASRRKKRREDVNKDENSINVQYKRGTSLQRTGCQYFSSLALTLCSDDIGLRGESKTKKHNNQ